MADAILWISEAGSLLMALTFFSVLILALTMDVT